MSAIFIVQVGFFTTIFYVLSRLIIKFLTKQLKYSIPVSILVTYIFDLVYMSSFSIMAGAFGRPGGLHLFGLSIFLLFPIGFLVLIDLVLSRIFGIKKKALTGE
jgi:hypothetical protein